MILLPKTERDKNIFLYYDNNLTARIVPKSSDVYFNINNNSISRKISFFIINDNQTNEKKEVFTITDFMKKNHNLPAIKRKRNKESIDILNNEQNNFALEEPKHKTPKIKESESDSKNFRTHIYYSRTKKRYKLKKSRRSSSRSDVVYKKDSKCVTPTNERLNELNNFFEKKYEGINKIGILKEDEIFFTTQRFYLNSKFKQKDGKIIPSNAIMEYKDNEFYYEGKKVETIAKHSIKTSKKLKYKNLEVTIPKKTISKNDIDINKEKMLKIKKSSDFTSNILFDFSTPVATTPVAWWEKPNIFFANNENKSSPFNFNSESPESQLQTPSPVSQLSFNTNSYFSSIDENEDEKITSSVSSSFKNKCEYDRIPTPSCIDKNKNTFFEQYDDSHVNLGLNLNTRSPVNINVNFNMVPPILFDFSFNDSASPNSPNENGFGFDEISTFTSTSTTKTSRNKTKENLRNKK